MKQIVKEAKIENINDMINFVLAGMHEKKSGSKKLIFEIKIICEEILTNIIKYAYPFEKGEIQLGYYIDEFENKIILRFCDKGIAFDPTAESIQNIERDCIGREIGGLGINMLKNLANSMLYERREGINELTITKILDEVL